MGGSLRPHWPPPGPPALMMRVGARKFYRATRNDNGLKATARPRRRFQMTNIGNPVRRFTVIPLNNPVMPTTEPVVAPAPPVKVPERVPEPPEKVG